MPNFCRMSSILHARSIRDIRVTFACQQIFSYDYFMQNFDFTESNEDEQEGEQEEKYSNKQTKSSQRAQVGKLLY